MAVVERVVYGDRAVRLLRPVEVSDEELLDWALSKLADADIPVSNSSLMVVVRERTIYIVRGDAVFG